MSSTAQSSAAPGKDSKPSCDKSQGWGASCRGRNERGATYVPSVESVLPWVLVVRVCTFSMGTWETGAHTALSLTWQVASPQELRTGQFVPRRYSLRSERTAAFGLCKVSRDWQGLRSVRDGEMGEEKKKTQSGYTLSRGDSPVFCRCPGMGCTREVIGTENPSKGKVWVCTHLNEQNKSRPLHPYGNVTAGSAGPAGYLVLPRPISLSRRL